MDLVRKMVSKKKRRFEWGNFDLDLSYITDRCIAMGFPSESIEGLYRNRMRDVQRFFETLHPAHYKVYNLCSERKYEHNRFEGRVSEYPFDDHSPPTLNVISEFCVDVEKWLDLDPENIVAIHCKAGKGRTGTMTACWLLYNKQCQTGSESMRIFANKRTHNSKGVTIPSQIRYVRYFEALLQYGRPVPKPPSVTKVLSMIKMNSLPNFNIAGGCEPYLSIVQQGKSVFYSKPLKLKKGTIQPTQQVELDCGNILLSNDVRIEFFNKNSKGHMFSYCFHTAFIEGTRIQIRRQEIDKAHKDVKHFPSNFMIELIFLEDDKGLDDDDSSSVSEESIEDKRVFNTSYATGLAKLYHHHNGNNGNGTNGNISNGNGLTASTSSNSLLSSSTLTASQKSTQYSTVGRSNFITGKKQTRSSRTAHICPKCSLVITPADASVNRNSENYHWKCMACIKCLKPLDDENNCLFEGNDPICIDCDAKDSGFFKNCSGCGLVIKTSDFEEFGNHIYHSSCFICYYCTSWLGVKNFIVHNDPNDGLKHLKCLNNCIEPKSESATGKQQQSKVIPVFINNNGPTLPIEICDKLDKEILNVVIEIDRSTEPTPVTSIDPIELLSPTSPDSFATVETTIVVEPILICVGCELPIGNLLSLSSTSSGRPIILDCGIYHRECFKCTECCDQTPMDPSLYYIRNDKPVCFDCDVNHIMAEAYSEIFCHGCNLTIKDEVMMDALNSKWHVGCLVCSNCGTQIEGQLGEHQGSVYCKDHYEELVGTRCDECSLYIDGMFLKVNGRQLCPSCFKCFCCSTILEGGKYYEKNGESICEKCRSEDIIKRKTQIHLQHSLINSLKHSQQLDESTTGDNNESQQPTMSITKSTITTTTTTTTNNSSNTTSPSLSTNVTPSSSPNSTIEKDAPYLHVKTRSLFRNSIKIHLEDLKNSGERKTLLYPSFHRQMRKQTFKTAYPSLRTRRNNFLNQPKLDIQNNNNNSSGDSVADLINAFIPPTITTDININNTTTNTTPI